MASTIIDEVFGSGTVPISAGTNNTGGAAVPSTQVTAYNAANAVNHAFNDAWVDVWGGVYGVDSSGHLSAVATLGAGNVAFFKTFLCRPTNEATLNHRVSCYFSYDSAQTFGLLARVNLANRTALQVLMGGGSFSGYGLTTGWANTTGPIAGTYTQPGNGTACIFSVTASTTFGIGSIAPRSPGSGYTVAPAVTIVGDGVGATATAALGTGIFADKVVGYTVTAAGSGYTWASAYLTPSDKGAGATAAPSFTAPSTTLTANLATQAAPGTSLGSASRVENGATWNVAGTVGFDNHFGNLATLNITEIKYESLDTLAPLALDMPTVTGDPAGNNIGLTWSGGVPPVKATLWEVNGPAVFLLSSYTNVGTISASGGAIRRTPPAAGARKNYRWQAQDGTGSYLIAPTSIAPSAGTGDSIYAFSAPLFGNPLAVFFGGDSITAGDQGAAPSLSTQCRACIDFLMMRLAPTTVTGYDYGVSGAKTADWLQGQAYYNNLKAAIIAAAPGFATGTKLVIHFMLGTNDAQGSIAAAVTTANLNAICASLTTDLAGAGVTQVPTFVLSGIPYNYIVNVYQATIDANAAIDAVAYSSSVLRGATSAEVYQLTGAHPEAYQGNYVYPLLAVQNNDPVHAATIEDQRLFGGARALGMAWGNGIYRALFPAASGGIKRSNFGGGF